MYKNKFLFAILVCILLSACSKEKTESAQKQPHSQTEIKTEKTADAITSDKIILEDDAQTVVVESSSDCAIPNKYFSKDDVFTAKGIAETIKTIDEKHFLQYLQSLIKSKAYEKLAAYNPYQEKELSSKTFEVINFNDGYSFQPETIKLQVSDKDIMEMEKYLETTYKYDDDCVTEIRVDKNGLDCINKKSKNKYIYKCRYFETEETYEYDDQGNLITTTNKDGEKTHYLYDANNNRIKEIYPNGTEVTYDYENGLCTCEHLSEFNIYKKYDDKNKLIEKFIPAHSSSWTNSEGTVITNHFPKDYEIYFYDDSGERIAEWNYDLEEESYEYDEYGNLIKTVSTYSGVRTYDAPEKPAQTDNQDYEDKRTIKNLAEEYDEKGHLIHHIIEDPCDSFERWYMNDKYGNVVIERVGLENGPDIKFFYEYDSKGNVIHKVKSSGGEHFFIYDENNQVKVHFSIWENLNGYTIRTFENGKVVNESSVNHNNNVSYYKGDKVLINQDTTYKYDEHGNMIYSLGARGYLYVVYRKYDYDADGRILKMQEYHNY